MVTSDAHRLWNGPKTKTGRFWTYVRDDRPAGSSEALAVWFAYSSDRKGEHPQRHLREFAGILQADAYAGFNLLYEAGRIQEAPCMAHVRRKFYDLVRGLSLVLRHRGRGANRATVRQREGDSKPPSRRAARGSTKALAAIAGLSAQLAARRLDELISKIGYHSRGMPDARRRRRRRRRLKCSNR